MSKIESWLRTGALLAVAGCACFCLWRVSVAADALIPSERGVAATLMHLDASIDAISGPRGTLDRVNATVDLVNRPCASKDANGHLLPDGPGCELTQAIHDIRKITTQSGEQVKQTGQLISATTVTMSEAGESVKQVAGKLSGTAQAATDTLVEARGTVKAAQPLLASLTRNSDDVNGIIRENSASLHLTLENMQGMTASGNGILANGKTVSDKITYDFMHPVPAWKQPMKILQLGFDAALLAK